MATQATPEQLKQFVAVVDDFMRKREALKSPATRAQVYATNNAGLISDYNSAVSKADALNATITGTVGAWNSAKAAYKSVTDKTSMVIGDAIDTIRSWFGYDPAPGIGGVPCGCHGRPKIELAGLGVVQLPAVAIGAIWITGIIAAAVALNKIIDNVMIQIQAAQIVRSDPNVSKADALRMASNNVAAGSFFSQAKLPLILLAAIAAYAFVGKSND